MDTTKEYSETHYYDIKNLKDFKNLVKGTPFFHDLICSNSPTGLFKSFIYSIDSLTEAITTLAFIDLPLVAAKHSMSPTESGILLKAASNLVCVMKQTEEALSDF